MPGGDVTPPGPQESRVEGLWAEASRRSFRLSFRSHVGSCCIWWSGSCLDSVFSNFQIILSWLLKTIVGDTFPLYKGESSGRKPSPGGWFSKPVSGFLLSPYGLIFCSVRHAFLFVDRPVRTHRPVPGGAPSPRAEKDSVLPAESPAPAMAGIAWALRSLLTTGRQEGGKDEKEGMEEESEPP